MKALPLFSLVLALGACRSEPPEPFGRLDRPSGLAVVQRTTVVDGDTKVIREDLLIADSEAEGVKVLQYLGNGFNFVHAPVVFFPLVIPAPNFPTEIAAPIPQLDPMSRPLPVNHAYVLSTGDGTLNVIDVTPLDFGGSPVDGDGNTHLRTIDLTTLGVGLIATDIVVVHSEGDTDLIAVSFEGVSAESALIFLRLNWQDMAPPSDPSGQTPANGLLEGEFAGSTLVLRSPRGIAARGVGSANVSVLLSSSTSSVTEVFVDPSADNVVRDSEEIDASGPTEDVLDAGPQGAFAIRSDRSRVVHLIPGLTGLMRSDAPDNSPLTPLEERRTRPLRGTIDVHDSPIGAAAVGFVAQEDTTVPPDGIPDENGVFFDPSPISTAALYTGINHPRTSSIAPVFTRADGAPLPVLLLAHADSFLSFVAVPDVRAELVTSADTFVARISASTMMEFQPIDPDAGNAPIGEPCAPINVCPQGGPNEVTCPLLVSDQGVGYNAYRATYRGTLASSQAPAITPIDGSTTAYRFADPGIASFDDRMVVPGDRVLAQVHNQNCDDLSATPIEVVATGTVTSVDGATLVVQFDVELIQTCEDVPPEELPFRSARYEVYPGDEVMVLARQAGPLVIEVVAREPVVSDANGSVVEFTDQLGVRISSPVRFTCTSSATDVPCASNLDCGIGRSCIEGGELGGCVRTCTAMCDDTDPVNCIRGLVGRGCSAADIEVLPTVPFVLPAGETTNASLQTFAPVGAVFSGARQSFVVSFPGSRILVEVRLTANGQVVVPIR